MDHKQPTGVAPLAFHAFRYQSAASHRHKQVYTRIFEICIHISTYTSLQISSDLAAAAAKLLLYGLSEFFPPSTNLVS
jgi:uncharacterized protein YdaL